MFEKKKTTDHIQSVIEIEFLEQERIIFVLSFEL